MNSNGKADNILLKSGYKFILALSIQLQQNNEKPTFEVIKKYLQNLYNVALPKQTVTDELVKFVVRAFQISVSIQDHPPKDMEEFARIIFGQNQSITSPSQSTTKDGIEMKEVELSEMGYPSGFKFDEGGVGNNCGLVSQNFYIYN